MEGLRSVVAQELGISTDIYDLAVSLFGVLNVFIVRLIANKNHSLANRLT